MKSSLMFALLFLTACSSLPQFLTLSEEVMQDTALSFEVSKDVHQKPTQDPTTKEK